MIQWNSIQDVINTWTKVRERLMDDPTYTLIDAMKELDEYTYSTSLLTFLQNQPSLKNPQTNEFYITHGGLISDTDCALIRSGEELWDLTMEDIEDDLDDAADVVSTNETTGWGYDDRNKVYGSLQSVINYFKQWQELCDDKSFVGWSIWSIITHRYIALTESRLISLLTYNIKLLKRLSYNNLKL